MLAQPAVLCAQKLREGDGGSLEVDARRRVALMNSKMKERFVGVGRFFSGTKCAAASRASLFLGLAITTVAAFGVGCCTSVREETPARLPTQVINFNSGDVGKLPADFTTALTGDGGPVSWVVREDPQAPGGRPVLVQESAETNNYRFPMCVYDQVVARDVAVEVKFKAISGKVDEAGGIVLRYTPGNYYIARANALENNVILFKTVNGVRSHIQDVPVPVAPGVWHTLRFEARGSQLTISLDGKMVLKRKDKTFTNTGKVGVWTKADSVTAFTDLKIEPAL